MYNFSNRNLNSISSYKTTLSNNLSNNNHNHIYFYFLFVKGGLSIFEKKIDNENIFKNEEEFNNFKILIKKIATKCLNNNSENTDIFMFNRFITDKLKIVILLKSNIALVGVFPLKSSKGFHNLLLIHLYISLINFKGDSIKKLNLLSKYITNNNNNYYTYKEFIEENKDKISNNEYKNLSNIDFLEISIYDQYFLIYCIIHFNKVINLLLKREDIDLSYTKFINLYIIDISSEQLLFDLKKEQSVEIIKYFLNNNLFKELIYHSHQLYDSYIEKYAFKYIKSDSSQWFVKFECTSTYPRLLFIIKFLPILKGIVIVHIYYQKKLSRNMNNNSLSINPDNRYKEVDLVFGSYLNENQGLDFKYVMPKKLTEIENFFKEFYITTRTCDLFKLNDPHKEFKYFNYNIINIINTITIDIKNSTQEKIFEYINDKIKKIYLEEHNKNIIKIKHGETKKEENNKNENEDNIFLIDKNMIYKDLFKNNNNDKNSTNQINDKMINYSTIKSNKNIINILRESPQNSINNIIKKKKENEEIKTITLMTESNLISKEENCSNNVIIDNLSSLVSEIKKKDNKTISKNKKENTILKKLKLQDLLNNSNSLNDISSSQYLKEKKKVREESESDLINKETSKNLIIQKENENKGKTRNRLKLFNNNIDFQNEGN